MADEKRLKVLGPADTKLGRPTIMDRALAHKHGAPYVRATVFAIDIDRVREVEQEEESLPFGWEVFLTETYLSRYLGGKEHVQLVEDLCLHVLELPRPRGDQAPALGSQLPFAVYAGVAHGLLSNALGTCFHVWKRPPTDLLDELEAFRRDPALLTRAIDYCLNVAVEPPLVALVREALADLSDR